MSVVAAAGNADTIVFGEQTRDDVNHRTPSGRDYHAAPRCLTAVVGVDAHVIVREVARPDAGAITTGAKRNANTDLGRSHRRPAGRLRIIRRETAVTNHANVVYPEANPMHVEPEHTRTADRREDAPPVGIGSEERRLNERRIGDGIRDFEAIGFRLAFGDLDGDEFR